MYFRIILEGKAAKNRENDSFAAIKIHLDFIDKYFG